MSYNYEENLELIRYYDWEEEVMNHLPTREDYETKKFGEFAYEMLRELYERGFYPLYAAKALEAGYNAYKLIELKRIFG